MKNLKKTSALRELLPRIASSTMKTPGSIAAVLGAPGVGLSSFVTALAQEEPASSSPLVCPPALGPVQFLVFLNVGLSGEPIAHWQRTGPQALARVVHTLRTNKFKTVVLDDAHRLYKPCLEMVEELARRTPVSFVLAGATAELDCRLARVPRLLGRLEKHHLAPLSKEDLAELLSHQLGTRLDPALAERLLERTGGNWRRLLAHLESARKDAARRLTLSCLADQLFPGGSAA